jgi:hypothetical protein
MYGLQMSSQLIPAMEAARALPSAPEGRTLKLCPQDWEMRVEVPLQVAVALEGLVAVVVGAYEGAFAGALKCLTVQV